MPRTVHPPGFEAYMANGASLGDTEEVPGAWTAPGCSAEATTFALSPSV